MSSNFQALAYLLGCSTWNRLVAQVGRLKKPKYLAGFFVGGLYFYFYFIRPIFLASGHPGARPLSGPEGLRDGLEVIGALILGVVLVGAWIFPHGRAALNFTEAEATFLFPAPVHRRTLIRFKLFRSQAAILLTTVFMALVSNRFGKGGAAWMHMVGWWLILSTINLHFLAASFARTRLLERGLSTWRLRLGILGLFLLVGMTLWWWARASVRAPLPSDLESAKNFGAYAIAMIDAPPLSWMLFPFRLVVRPFFAESAREFAMVAWPAVLTLCAHYLWVIRSDVAFEEASLALAQRRAELLATARREQGRMFPRKRRNAPFVLAPIGAPAVALLWKNLIGAGSIFTLRMWILIGIAFGIPAVTLGLSARGGDFGVVVGMILVMAFIWSVMIGPQVLRQDFRQDLRAAEMLKLYPLAGWRIVLGELLAPMAILTVVQWLVLFLLVVLFPKLPGVELQAVDRMAAALGVALVCPGINLLSLLIPNAAVLLFPAWLSSGPSGPQGIEATGQRLIFFFGQVLVLALALIPAAAVFVAVQLAGTMWLAWQWVVPVAALGAALTLLGEGALGVMLLGRLFERLDVASELRGT